MKQQHKNAIQAVMASGYSKEFVDYLEVLCNKIADVRNFNELTEAEAKGRNIAVNIITSELIEVLSPDRASGKVNLDEYE